MSTLNMNIIKIRRYLESVPTLKDELQQDRIYTDIIENTVKGLVSRGSGTENDHTKIFHRGGEFDSGSQESHFDIKGSGIGIWL